MFVENWKVKYSALVRKAAVFFVMAFLIWNSTAD